MCRFGRRFEKTNCVLFDARKGRKRAFHVVCDVTLTSILLLHPPSPVVLPPLTRGCPSLYSGLAPPPRRRRRCEAGLPPRASPPLKPYLPRADGPAPSPPPSRGSRTRPSQTMTKDRVAKFTLPRPFQISLTLTGVTPGVMRPEDKNYQAKLACTLRWLGLPDGYLDTFTGTA